MKIAVENPAQIKGVKQGKNKKKKNSVDFISVLLKTTEKMIKNDKKIKNSSEITKKTEKSEKKPEPKTEAYATKVENSHIPLFFKVVYFQKNRERDKSLKSDEHRQDLNIHPEELSKKEPEQEIAKAKKYYSFLQESTEKNLQIEKKQTKNDKSEIEIPIGKEKVKSVYNQQKNYSVKTEDPHTYLTEKKENRHFYIIKNNDEKNHIKEKIVKEKESGTKQTAIQPSPDNFIKKAESHPLKSQERTGEKRAKYVSPQPETAKTEKEIVKNRPQKTEKNVELNTDFYKSTGYTSKNGQEILNTDSRKKVQENKNSEQYFIFKRDTKTDNGKTLNINTHKKTEEIISSKNSHSREEISNKKTRNEVQNAQIKLSKTSTKEKIQTEKKDTKIFPDQNEIPDRLEDNLQITLNQKENRNPETNRKTETIINRDLFINVEESGGSKHSYSDQNFSNGENKEGFSYISFDENIPENETQNFNRHFTMNIKLEDLNMNVKLNRNFLNMTVIFHNQTTASLEQLKNQIGDILKESGFEQFNLRLKTKDKKTYLENRKSGENYYSRSEINVRV
ncbi:MAG TPA: hypothetical protein DEP48_05900 [Persephonella sp.]|uniref:Uncharacterized protein n=1 Tax=Persephonella marina (strain DSM 14350 / EX-H1) TaxID=123214 RepID=C0QPB4_PERMH|nr:MULTISPECIES: hypothetical protein [Persephonella]ACO03614.1 hypothetical protein PERMA_0722 [Persephonella marina EX-H1]HCB69875.1 hypothetical protein [Persephonella sp.]